MSASRSHDVGVFHKLEVLAAGAAFLHLIEHGGRFEQGALFIRHDALLDRITQRDVDRVSRVYDQTCRWAVAAVLMTFSSSRYVSKVSAFNFSGSFSRIVETPSRLSKTKLE